MPSSPTTICVTAATPVDACPFYLWMLTPTKLHKVLHSSWPAFWLKRRRLRRRDVGVASVKLLHPRIHFHHGNKDVNRVYQQCRLVHGDLLYIPVEIYHRTVIQMKIRSARYFCQLLGVRRVTYKYNDNSRDVVDRAAGAHDATHSRADVEVSTQTRHERSTENESLQTFPAAPAPYILCTPAEFRAEMVDPANGVPLCPRGFLDHLEVQHLLLSRLQGHMNEITFTLEEQIMDAHETKVVANIESLWGSTFRSRRDKTQTFSVSFHLWFYPVEKLLGFHNIRYTPEHFFIIRNTESFTLLDAFVEKQLSWHACLRYKCFKLVAAEKAEELVRNMRVYRNVTHDLVEYLERVSLASFLTYDDAGLHMAYNLTCLIHHYFRDTDMEDSVCYDIYCDDPACVTQAERPLFTYLIGVYNLHADDADLFVPRGPEHAMVRQLKDILRNVGYMPTFAALVAVVRAGVLSIPDDNDDDDDD